MVIGSMADCDVTLVTRDQYDGYQITIRGDVLSNYIGCGCAGLNLKWVLSYYRDRMITAALSDMIDWVSRPDNNKTFFFCHSTQM